MRPVVSVVIPTHGRPKLLARCVRAVMRQDLVTGLYEVIVADDEAAECTRLRVAAWAARYPVPLRYVRVEGSHGPAAARNQGWRAARGEIIAFTDDDTLPDREWLHAGLRAFRPEVIAVAGRLHMPVPDEPSDYELNASLLQEAEFVTANCFVRRETLERLGGFDERFRVAWREDTDLHFRLLGLCQEGARIVRAPDALVVHPVRPAPWGVSLRQQRKNVFNALLYKKHPTLYREKVQRLPPLHYYAMLGSAALGMAGAESSMPALAVAGLGAWAVLSARFFLKRLQRTRRSLDHVVEMVVTSVLLPPVAVFWRLVGAFRYRVVFA